MIYCLCFSGLMLSVFLSFFVVSINNPESLSRVFNATLCFFSLVSENVALLSEDNGRDSSFCTFSCICSLSELLTLSLSALVDRDNLDLPN